MKRWLILAGMLVLLLAITFGVSAQLDEYGNLRLGNEYIEIFVNANEENMGRFAVDITGGNPVLPGDDNEPLIYGRPRPWTSYSTIFLDGEYYVFGGMTEKRAGRSGQYGVVVDPPNIITEGNQKAIQTATLFGNVLVEQILTFSKSSTTGLYDTVLIRYRFTNNDTERHKIGLRVMLDTMLGTNDGAPFRIGAKAITTDTYFIKGSLPDFWQAFDALSNPKVTAQGTIKGPDVTLPDKVYFADWGSMADGLWEFNFDPGEEFWREGEFELDSAIALYWAPQYLEPGETQTFVSKYGLGGITVVPGLLSLGVTSPAEVIFDTQTTTFPIIGYVENTSEIVAKDVMAQIQLPDNFTVVSQTINKDLGDLASGDTAQVAWEVAPRAGAEIPEQITYQVKVTASNTDSNQVSRQVKFTPPPRLECRLIYPDNLAVNKEDYLLDPNPLEARLKIENMGGSPAYEVKGRMVLPPGLEYAHLEKMDKLIGSLQPGEEYVIPWNVRVLEDISGTLPFEVDLYSLNSPRIVLIGNVVIPELNSKIYLLPLKEKIQVGDYFGVQVRAGNIMNMDQLKLDIKYNTSLATAMYVSRGTLFLADGQPLPWQEGDIDRDNGLVQAINGDLSESERETGVIAEIFFKAVEPGTLVISPESVEILNEFGKEISFEIEDITLEIYDSKGGK